MSPSIWQILIVLVIILIFFGPKRIPGLGKSLGEAINGFKKGLNDDTIDVTDSQEQISQNANNQQKSEQKQSEKQDS